MKKSVLFLLFVFTASLFSQSLSVFDVDTTNFPVMKAKFWAFDGYGKQILNLSSSDFEITEDGAKRNVIKVSCPSPGTPEAISAVLVMDVSGSMAGMNIEMAKEGAKAWITGLPLGKSECAITSFDTKNYFVQDFTTDKNKLESKLLDVYKGGGTDYNAAFTSPMAGGILVAKTGKHKKVIIFISDGQPNFEPNTQEIINQALQNWITVFSITLGYKCPQCLIDISEKTGGQWFENVTTEEQARQVYQKILQMIQGAEPCTIEWESGISCNDGITNAKLRNTNINMSAETNYHAPDKPKALLEFSPLSVTFKNVSPGIVKDTIITITARNTDVNVLNVLSSNLVFDINPKTITLKKDESKDFTVTYTPIDSVYSISKFDFETDLCPFYYYSSGTFKKYKIKPSTLKLTNPNGGETFVVGNDTVITWEGISPNDTVKLEYCIDSGFYWKNIVSKTSGLEFKWKNVPKPESYKCIVRVSQGEVADSIEPDNQAPQILWQKTFGGRYSDHASSIIESKDGTYVIAGYSDSNDGDVTINKGGADIWIVKMNPIDDNIIWQKSLGGSSHEFTFSILESSDLSYIVAGVTGSTDGDVTVNKGLRDIWVVKLNAADGSIIWQKSYGGSENDYAYSIIESRDGSYVVTGTTLSNDGDVTANKGGQDAWIVKIDSADGSIIWQKSLGGSNYDVEESIIESSDGSYVVAGTTLSKDGDVTANKGGQDAWIVKLNEGNGNVIWQRTFGGSEIESGCDLIESSDGSYVLAGVTNSNDGDVNGFKGGLFDIWVVKLKSVDGSIIWQNTIGGKNNDGVKSIIEGKDKSYILSGYTNSTDGDVTVNKGDYDYWILKLKPSNGNIIWQKTLGGSQYELAFSIIKSGDGSLVVAGETKSIDFDVTENKGAEDIWIVKLQDGKILQSDISDSVFAIVEPSAQSKDIDMKLCLVGDFKDSVITAFITNTGSWKVRIDTIYFEGADKDKFYLVSRITPFTVYSAHGLPCVSGKGYHLN